MGLPTRWLRTLRRTAAPRRSLVCIPHAGGSAATFAKWPGGLPDDIDVFAVELPARGTRFAEPPVADMDTVLSALVHELVEVVGPIALFGHSMGGIVAYEVARRMRTHVDWLIVSGCRAPHLPAPEGGFSDLPDGDFAAEVSRRYGSPIDLRRHPELLGAALPGLRADVRLIERWAFEHGPPLNVPLHAVCGAADRWVAPEEVAAWAALTRARFTTEVLPGDHFLHLAEPTEMARRVARRLS